MVRRVADYSSAMLSVLTKAPTSPENICNWIIVILALLALIMSWEDITNDKKGNRESLCRLVGVVVVAICALYMFDVGIAIVVAMALALAFF